VSIFLFFVIVVVIASVRILKIKYEKVKCVYRGCEDLGGGVEEVRKNVAWKIW
jgi:hypothetical protein